MNKTNKTIKSTANLDNLLNQVQNLSDLEEYLQGNLIPEFENISDYLNYMLEAKKLEKSEVIFAANLDRIYGYQIFSGQKKNPSRDRLLALCIAMGMNLEEITRALSISNCGKLYSKNTRDAVLIYAINKGLSVSETNDTLDNFGEDPFDFLI